MTPDLRNNGPVVFDLDNTLLPTNTGGELLRSLLAQKLIPAPKLIRFYVAFGLFRARLLRDEAALREAANLLVGQEVRALDALAGACVENIFNKLFFAEALERVEMHRANGSQLILLTGEPEFLVQRIGALLRFDHSIGTHFLQRDGFVKGLEEPLGYREGKVALLRSRQLLDAAPHVYTDDLADLPLLRVARSASLVNPKPALAAEVEALGIPYETLRWTRTIGEQDARETT